MAGSITVAAMGGDVEDIYMAGNLGQGAAQNNAMFIVPLVGYGLIAAGAAITAHDVYKAYEEGGSKEALKVLAIDGAITIIAGGVFKGAYVVGGKLFTNADEAWAAWRASESGLAKFFNAGVKNISDIPLPKSLDSDVARKWYVKNVEDIVNQLDKSLPLEGQAKQAVDLRNFYRNTARDAMKDVDVADGLRFSKPNLSYEQLFEKYSAQGFSGDALYHKIISAATHTNTEYNLLFGIMK